MQTIQQKVHINKTDIYQIHNLNILQTMTLSITQRKLPLLIPPTMI